MKKVILDACPSADNYFGILYACKRLDVKALLLRDDALQHETLAYNLGVIHARNPLQMPIAWGSTGPMLENGQSCSHYRGVRLPGSVWQAPNVTQEHAWDLLYRVAKQEGKVTIVTLSSLTNLAIALFKYEDLREHIEQVVCMGGTTCVGNVAPYAEANLFEDPYAAEGVVRFGIPVSFVGLDVPRAAACPLPLQAEQQAVLSLLQADALRYPYQGQVALHDCLTIEAAAAPQHFVWESWAGNVEYKSSLCAGRLNLDIRKHCDDPKNITIATGFAQSIDQQSFLA